MVRVELLGWFAEREFGLVLTEEDEREDAGVLAGFAALDLQRGVAGGGGFFQRQGDDRFLGFAEDEEFKLVGGVAADGEHEELGVGGGFAGADAHGALVGVGQRAAVFPRSDVAQPEMPERHGVLAGLGELVGGDAFVGDDEGAGFARADGGGFGELEFADEREIGEVLGRIGEDLRVFLRVGTRDELRAAFLGGRQRGGEEEGEERANFS